MTIKDQDLSKNRELLRNIVSHAVEQANFTIRCLNKRSTVHMLMQCEDTITDLLPIVKLIAEADWDYVGVCDQMKNALDAAQVGGEPQLIEL